jgi:hypothetical protein
VHEINNLNEITSECKTPCVWEAFADLMMKSRLPLMHDGVADIQVSTMKGGLTENGISIKVKFSFEHKKDISLELKGTHENVSALAWSETSDALYLSDIYRASHKTFVVYLKGFLKDRASILIPLISFALSNKGHLFWSNYQGESRDRGINGASISKTFKM